MGCGWHWDVHPSDAPEKPGGAAGGRAGGSGPWQNPQRRASKEGCLGTCSCREMGLQGEAKQRSPRKGNGSLLPTVR